MSDVGYDDNLDKSRVWQKEQSEGGWLYLYCAVLFQESIPSKIPPPPIIQVSNFKSPLGHHNIQSSIPITGTIAIKTRPRTRLKSQR